MTLADRIVVLNHGVVEQVGAPIELYDRPANIFVAGFIGQPRMNFLEARVANRGEGVAGLALPAAAAPVEVPLPVPPAADARVTLGIRPDGLKLADAPADLAGRVEVVEHLGSESIVHVAVEGAAELVTVVAPGRTSLRHGDPVSLRIDKTAAHVFDAAGKAIR
jgi:ABC-type sugar transport system ATPase subunit